MLVIGMNYQNGEVLYFPVVKGVALRAYPGRDGFLRALAIAEFYRLQDVIDEYFNSLRFQSMSYLREMEIIRRGQEDDEAGRELDRLMVKRDTVMRVCSELTDKQMRLLRGELGRLNSVTLPFKTSEFAEKSQQLDEHFFLGISVRRDYRSECIFLHEADENVFNIGGFDNLEAAFIAANEYRQPPAVEVTLPDLSGN